MRGTRPDGSTLMSKDGAPVYSAFFQQSSFATHVIANERYIVKVRKDAPLELLGPFACSGQTGAGAVLNSMRPKPGDSFAVFGVGAVGLSALMAAKIAGCEPIIAVDVHEAMPESASAHVNATVTSLLFHPFELGSGVAPARIVGGTESQLSQVIQTMRRLRSPPSFAKRSRR